MAEIGRWNGHKFEVSPTIIRGFTGLTIKGSSETEDKDSGDQKYVSRKSGKPIEVSLTVLLNAQFGCDVRSESKSFIADARAGKKDYFYVGSKKLVMCQLMLTEASISALEITNNGTWLRAEVKLTMKQCTKNDGSISTTGGGSSGGGGSGGGGSGSGKTSVKTTGIVSKIVNGAKTVINNVVNGVKNAVTTVKNVLSGKTTLASVFTSTVKSAVGVVKTVSAAASAFSAVKKVASATIKRVTTNVRKK